MVTLFFAGDTRVPAQIVAPQMLLIGAMVYGLGPLVILTVIVLHRYHRAVSVPAVASEVSCRARGSTPSNRWAAHAEPDGDLRPGQRSASFGETVASHAS
jgi:hypothetical protein